MCELSCHCKNIECIDVEYNTNNFANLSTPQCNAIACSYLNHIFEFAANTNRNKSLQFDGYVSTRNGKEAFVQIDQTEDGAVIYPRYLDIAAWSEMIALYPKKSITVIASAKPSVRCKNKSGEPILPFICGLLKKYIQIKSKKE